MTPSVEVIVIGGGAVGAACAREIASRGRGVLIIDRGTDEGQAWRAAAGMLAAQTDAGRELIYTVAPELQESSGVDLALRRDGIARVALTEDEVGSLRGKVAWQRQQGHLVDWLDAAETRSRYPWAGKARGARDHRRRGVERTDRGSPPPHLRRTGAGADGGLPVARRCGAGDRAGERGLRGAARRRGDRRIHHGSGGVPPGVDPGGARAPLHEGERPRPRPRAPRGAAHLGGTPAGDAGRPPDHRAGAAGRGALVRDRSW